MSEQAAPPVARLSQVALSYRGVTALAGIDLELPAGAAVALIGPDGVGKSSLLALVAGARRVQSGRVEVFGGDLAQARFRARVQPRIAYMPQGLGRNLYPSLSVAENVDCFGRLFDQDPRERQARSAELLAATGLARFGDRPASQLSGGMKQKLGLCCALMHDPELLILDEPTTGVDPLSRRQFWELIAAMRARRPGLSVLVATAYMEEAERFERLVALDAGRIVGSGSAAELKERTGSATLEQAFIRLLPEARRRGHAGFTLPPRRVDGGAQQPPAIEADALTMRFGDFTAVDGASFQIAAGEIFGFIGSNGCGKTTTMKMLTGLLAPSSGVARLFGREIDARDLATRRQVGYMSQSFSLYGELSVAQNLDLHARLFGLDPQRREQRIAELGERFGLARYAEQPAAGLPLGIRQRLSLAVAVVHEPRLLILDEPTSGVDPIARDLFWQLLVDLARGQGVTIFISTHFMNEAERCDRVALMHAGRVLASDSPAAIRAVHGARTLEQAFIACLQAEAAPEAEDAPRPLAAPRPAAPRRSLLSPRRLLGVAWRESVELLRDRIRLAFALAGALLLMLVLGYGISMDVENLRFAVLDRDRTPESRDYIANLAGSRYFIEQPELGDATELDRRMSSGELALALEIPPGYGRDLRAGRMPEIGAWVDGALPFRGETARGYLQGLHSTYLADRIARTRGGAAAEISLRYRYNQDFRSLDAMVPAVIPLLLIFLPAILTALAVVREKELGSITNLYVTPVTRLEFLLGKQLPYVAIAMLSFALLLAQAVWVFGVALKGSVAALFAGTLLYAFVTTGFGLLISSFTRTQIAALFGTAVLTMLPTVQFSGLTTPVASLSGPGYWIGQGFPASHYLVICRGVFTKALGFSDLWLQFAVLAAYVPLLCAASVALLPAQEK